jgi:hypothetical protein
MWPCRTLAARLAIAAGVILTVLPPSPPTDKPPFSPIDRGLDDPHRVKSPHTYSLAAEGSLYRGFFS